MNKYATVALICLSILVVSCNSLEKAGNVLINEINKSASPPEARPRDAEQIKKSVVRITAKESSQGTGFVVGVNGDTVYILTAYHVVKNDSTPNVEFFGEPREFQAKVLENDDKVDISLLAVTGSTSPWAIPLYVANNFVLKPGESVFTFGFPLGGGDWAHDDLSYSSPKGREILFSDSDIKEGNSGGPLVRGDEVIGMVTGVTDFAYALSAVSIREFLRGAKGGEIVLSHMEKWRAANWRKAYDDLKEVTMPKSEPAVIKPVTPTEPEENLLEGIIEAFSTAPEKLAFDGGEEKYGLYTKYLLQEMQKSQKIEDVFRRVSRLVSGTTNGQQVPWYNASLSGGSFCFGGCSKTLSNSVKQLALVIGNAKYPFYPLKNPTNDAQGMAKVLNEKGFEVILRTDTNLFEMNEAIQEFVKRLSAENGVGLFYFSGIGGQIEGKDYLVPIDDRQGWEDNMVSVDSIVEQMQSANSKLNIVILDSCRNEISPPSEPVER